jgi:hypothetical protein
MSHLVLRPKPDAHHTYAQEQFAIHNDGLIALHTSIVTIEYNYYRDNVVKKTRNDSR